MTERASTIERPMPPPLPDQIKDWTRYLKAERSINDAVEEVHRTLVPESPEYRKYLRAVWDSQAVEGSCAMDNAMAAIMLRKKAEEIGSEVAGEKLDTINKALGVVLRRYHASRKQRRNTVAGEEVPAENASSGE